MLNYVDIDFNIQYSLSLARAGGVMARGTGWVRFRRETPFIAPLT